MGSAARNQRRKFRERPESDPRRFGVLALLALLVFIAAPGLRLVPGAGLALGVSASGETSTPKAGAAGSGGDALLRLISRQATSDDDRLPEASDDGLAAARDLPPSTRTAIRSAAPLRSLAGTGRSRLYDPRGPPPPDGFRAASKARPSLPDDPLRATGPGRA